MLPSKNDVLSMYNKVSSKVKQYALNLTPLELKVEEATSNEPWGPHGTVMAEISKAAYDYESYKQIMGVVARRLQSEGENWRHVYKSLLLLEYMAKHGPQKVVDELSSNINVVEKLQRFEYQDKNSRDWGLNVRQRAKELANLIGDPERIRRERQKAKQNETKYTGVSAEESRLGYGGSSGFGSSSTPSSAFGGGSALGSIGGAKGFGSSQGLGSATGFRTGSGLSSGGRYDPDTDSGLIVEDSDPIDEDAKEATRKRIQSLKKTAPSSAEGGAKVSPLKGSSRGHSAVDTEAKAPKRLSQVKVDPNIAMSLGVPSKPAMAGSPAQQSHKQAAATTDASAAPILDLFGDEDAAAPAKPTGDSQWDAFAGSGNGSTFGKLPAAQQDDWSDLLDGSNPPTMTADPFAALTGDSQSAAPNAGGAATPSDSPAAGGTFASDPFAAYSSVQKASGPLPLAPAPQKPNQDPFAMLTSADPFAPPAAKPHSPLRASGSATMAQADSFSPFFEAPSTTAVPGNSPKSVAPTSQVGMALPEDMFSAPMAAPSMGAVHVQVGTTSLRQGGGSPTTSQAFSSSPILPGRGGSSPQIRARQNTDPFASFGTPPPAHPSSTEDMFGSMSIAAANPSDTRAEALGGGVKMAPHVPQPNLPPPVTKQDPFAGLAGF